MVDPYAPPRPEPPPPDPPDEVVEFRRQLLGHEASIRFYGALITAAGMLAALPALPAFLLMVFGVLERPSSAFNGVLLAIGSALGGLGVLLVWTGQNLERLQEKARAPALGVAALALLAFPIGTLGGGYLIYLLLSEKGRVVLSNDYRIIVAATPGVRPRTSVVAWALVAALILGPLGLLVAALLSP